MKLQAHFNAKSKKWIISLAVMLIVSVGVVFGTIAIDKVVTEKNNQPVELGFEISSTSPMSVEENELSITGVDKAVDSQGNTVAYVITGTTVGYNQESPIQMSTTVSADASVVCNIDIISQEETEYLGVRIMDDSFQNQFKARKLPVKGGSSITKGSSVDLIARSTVSSQAVVDAVNRAQEYVATFLAE